MTLLLLASAALAQPPVIAVNLGFSGNLDQGYSFLSVTPALGRTNDASLTLNATVSDIYYEYADPVVHRVQSPGVSVGPGFVYAPRDLALGFNAGFEVRRPTLTVETAPPDDVTLGDIPPETSTTLGANLAANLYWYPQHKTILYGILSFNTADEYLWARVGALRPLIPMFQRDAPVSLWLGLEATTAGNQLTRVEEVGAVAQVPIAKIHTTISARGGVSLQGAGGTVTTQPTVGLGLYWQY